MEVNPNFNFLNIFIISATIQGFLFCGIFLLNKKRTEKSTLYLVITILLISIYNLYFWFIDTKLWLVFDWTSYKATFFISWELLMLPMYYFFIASYLGEKEKIKKYYTYPFFISLIIHVIIAIGYHTTKDFYNVYCFIVCPYDVILSYFSLGYSFFMVFMIFKLIYKYEKEQKLFNLKAVSINTKWLKQLLSTTLILCFLSLTVRIYNLVNIDNKVNDDFVWAIMSVLLYWLCYAGIYHLGIFNQRKAIRSNTISRNKSLQISNTSNTSNRFQEIDHLITQERLYLNPNLSLGMLAEKFNLSEGYLSQLINNNTNNNFSTYLNNLRIEESKLLLTNSDYKNYTIIAIALESGFNSKSTFYNAFKKQTGISPSDFKKSNLNLS